MVYIVYTIGAFNVFVLEQIQEIISLLLYLCF